MDQDQEKRRVCKFCNESFSNGKSLGGHMRSHGSAAKYVKGRAMVESSNKDFQGYGLRENPRKSWRSVQESVKCEVCDKDFGSLKSLYGHMRLHPPQERKGIQCKQCGRLFWSPKSLSNHMRLHCKEVKGSSKPDNLGAMSLSDSDIEIVSLARRKRSSRLRYKLSTPDSSFCSLNESASVSVSGFETEQELEDAAMSLIMMSKGQFGGSNSSKRNVISEGAGVSDDEDAVKIKKFARTEKFDSCTSDSGEPSEHCDKGIEPVIPELENESRRGGFQCRICNKTFLTHQSLGGHQTSHRVTKRSEGFKTDSFPIDEQIEFSLNNEAAEKFLKLNCIQNSEEHELSGVTDNVNWSKEHKCGICFKVFLSGQALGGHKRAHVGKPDEEEPLEIEDNCKYFNIPIDEQIEFSLNNEAAEKFLKLNCIQDSEEHELSGVTDTVNGSKEHRCGICFKLFHSGQALGGHKRAHVGKPDEEEPLEIEDKCKDININLTHMIEAEETDQDSGLQSWWGGCGNKQEPLQELIAH